MVIADELERAVCVLKESGNDNPYFEAHLILHHVLGLSPTDIVLGRNKEISEENTEKIKEIVKRRAMHEPLQYILKSQEFMGLEFYVDENVLIPRADTETLVEYVLEYFGGKGITCMDIGTGSGCIAVSIASFNKNAFIRAVDISDKALEIAKRNAEKNGVSDRISFEKADIFEYIGYGKYDLIVSNPPYIESSGIEKLQTEVQLFEPHTALDGGEDGLDYYRRIIQIAPVFLKKDAMIAFEVGHTQAKAVSQMLADSFHDVEIINDLRGVQRVVSGLYNGI